MDGNDVITVLNIDAVIREGGMTNRGAYKH
jgi:hypothetical protein